MALHSLWKGNTSMNKFIPYDIHNGIVQLKCAIMNALNDIDSKEEKEINLGEYIPESLVYHCLVVGGWKTTSILKDENYTTVKCISPSNQMITIELGKYTRIYS